MKYLYLVYTQVFSLLTIVALAESTSDCAVPVVLELLDCTSGTVTLPSHQQQYGVLVPTVQSDRVC